MCAFQIMCQPGVAAQLSPLLHGRVDKHLLNVNDEQLRKQASCEGSLTCESGGK